MRIEKQKRQGARIARCRTCLRNGLGWLPGFPAGLRDGRVSWMPVPQLGVKGPGPLDLDAEHLRRAGSAWTILVRDFPRALPLVVADVDRWKEGVPRTLGWLTDAVQRGEPLPLLALDAAIPSKVVARAERLAARRPGLRALVSAASWSRFLVPAELPEVLEWIEANAGAVEVVVTACPGASGVVDLLMVAALAKEDERSISQLLRAVGVPRASRSSAGAEVLEFATWIGGQPRSVRRRALGLLELVLYDGLLDDGGIDLAELAENWSHTRRVGPAEVLGAFKTSLAAKNAGFHRDLLRLVGRLPRAKDARFRFWFLALWSRGLEGAHDSGLVVRLLREVDRYLSSRPDSTLIDSWLGEASEDPRWLLALRRIAGGKFRGRWQTLFDAISQIGALPCKRPVACADVPLICDLVVATSDAGNARECFRQLNEARLRDTYWEPERDGLYGKHIDIEVLQLACELDTEAKLFAALVSHLAVFVSHLYPEPRRDRLSLLRVIDGRLTHVGWTGVTAALIAERQLGLLHTCAQRYVVAEALRIAVDPDPPLMAVTPVWAQRYPEALQPALAALAAVANDAERIAAGVLAKDFPHPDDLQREIAALVRQVAGRPERRRLQRLSTLRERLRSPRAVSSVRIERLRAKLESRTRRCVLQGWRKRLDAELMRRFLRLLRTDEVPAWMFEPPQLRMLASIMSLSPTFRTLSWRSLRARVSSASWNLVDDPANCAYLARMRNLGVDVRPWLNTYSRSCVGQNGRKVELAIERDPLEIFQMGAHFQTCLSPGGDKFFSVFAIAADINKHVVYARDASRAVVGRCILALTDEGRVLTFYPYCHDVKLGFDNMIVEFAQELAGKMKTHVVGRGAVRCLVAPRWYDDEPVDVSFPFLAEGSEFRKSLSELAARGEFVACLRKQFTPMPLDGYALSLVLELREFDVRPALIRPLLPLLDRCKRLDYERDCSDPTWMRVALIAAAAGESAFVRRIVRKWSMSYPLSRGRVWRSVPENVVGMLMEHDPGAAIRLVRATRAPGVRSDEEDEGRRRLYLARAFELLGRPAQARRMRSGVPLALSANLPWG